jgi:hypothetical protein
MIPEALQIDAVLSGRTGSIVERFCGGAWDQLGTHWTVSFGQIVEEAKRLGLESFVHDCPASEGFWLLRADSGYVVVYVERGIHMYHEAFVELEPAFRRWLDQELRSHLLPGEAGA